MQEVCATYQISEDDLLEGQVSHAGKLYRVGQVAGAILIAVGFAGILVIRPMNYGPVIPLLAGLFLMFRLRLVTRLSFGRDFAGKGNVDVRVTSSGIALRTTNVTADLSWSAFERFVESKHLVILYGQSNIFHLVPKRAFSADDLSMLHQVLEENLGAKSAKFNRKVSPQMFVFLAVLAFVSILLTMVVVKSMR